MKAEYSKEPITKCMSLTVQSGASEGSAEEQRQVFLTINTDAGRVAFLRRWCRAKEVE
jgi:hypothetical protein